MRHIKKHHVLLFLAELLTFPYMSCALRLNAASKRSISFPVVSMRAEEAQKTSEKSLAFLPLAGEYKQVWVRRSGRVQD